MEAIETPQGSRIAAEFSSVSDTYDGIGIEDPYALYRALRRDTPVIEGDMLAKFRIPSQADYANKGRQVFSVFKNEDVLAILRDQETWTSSLLMDGLGAFLGDVMLTGLGGEQHRKLRNLLQPCFAPSVLKRWNETLMGPIIEGEYLARMRPRGRAELVGDFAIPFPVRIIYAILGFPIDDPQAMDQFAGMALRILAGPQTDPEKSKVAVAAAFAAAQELYDLTRPIVERRRAEGAKGDDMIAFLLRAESEGLKLDDHQITNLVRMLLPAAAETTTRTFGNMMIVLFDHPEVLERVRQDRSLIGKALTESMRYETVAAWLAREATRDVTLRGVTIPKGAAVSLAVASANRDETIHERPDVFDIDRPLKPVISFGFGVHTCIGMQVARMEIETAVNALLDLPNLRLDPDQPHPRIRGLQLRGPDTLHVVWDV